jgi:hypothetical protein
MVWFAASAVAFVNDDCPIFCFRRVDLGSGAAVGDCGQSVGIEDQSRSSGSIRPNSSATQLAEAFHPRLVFQGGGPQLSEGLTREPVWDPSVAFIQG